VLVFVLVGAWHSLKPYWLLFGLFHGLGFWAFIVYRQRHRGAADDGIFAHPTVGACLTYVFVCLSWYIPGKLVIASLAALDALTSR
jgi:D-alanyl-lipoteichoic acid acyltransferase DltB (MBOAT superfamily)